MGAGGRDGEASEGVVPGSTNQRQDAIDRHVAPGWCNEFRFGGRGRQSSSASALAETAAAVVVAERRQRVAADRERKGSSRPGGGRRGTARVLHTPLHLLVNRINQRHHGLSPIPLHLRASTFLNLLSPSPRRRSCSSSFLRHTTSAGSIPRAIYSQRAPPT